MSESGSQPQRHVVLVCGGRHYNDEERLRTVLDKIHTDRTITLLIHGGATGADQLAADWAVAKGVPLCCFPADWKSHGKAAGPIRNQQMLTNGKPDLVVAFPGGRGTADMIRKAALAGVKQILVE